MKVLWINFLELDILSRGRNKSNIIIMIWRKVPLPSTVTLC